MSSGQVARDAIKTVLNYHLGNNETRIHVKDLLVDLRDLGFGDLLKPANSDGSLRGLLESYGCKFDGIDFVLTASEGPANAAVSRQIMLMQATPGSKPMTPPTMTKHGQRGGTKHGQRGGGFVGGPSNIGTRHRSQGHHSVGFVRGTGHGRQSGYSSRQNGINNNNNNNTLTRSNGFTPSWKSARGSYNKSLDTQRPLQRGEANFHNTNRGDGCGSNTQMNDDEDCYCYHQRGGAFQCFHELGFDSDTSPSHGVADTVDTRPPYGAPSHFVGYEGYSIVQRRREDPNPRCHLQYGSRGTPTYRNRNRGRGAF